MDRIASFCVDHDTLTKGVYISRIDSDVITYDIRMKTPNGGDYLSADESHTIEHLFATFARNSKFKNSIIYVGPMGCRTGFYLLTRGGVSRSEILELLKNSFAFIASFEGKIPGTERKECGNYLGHDLTGAVKTSREFLTVLANVTADKMDYPMA